METLGLLWALMRLAFLIRVAEVREDWGRTEQLCAGRYRIGMRPLSRAHLRWLRCRVRRFMAMPSRVKRHVTIDDDASIENPCGCKEAE